MFIRTPRLLLRPFWSEDAPALHALLGDWEIVCQTGSVDWPFGPEDAAARIARETLPGESDFGIFLREVGGLRLAGGIGFGHWNERVPYAELGYWVARDCWGQGIATEAGRAVLELGFEGLRLPRLGAGHYTDNPASAAVLRKLGFTPTGEVLPYPCRARGADFPSVEYLLTREQWQARFQAARAAA